MIDKVKEKLIRYILKEANVKNKFLSASFENYELENGNRKAVKVALDFTENFIQNKNSLRGIYIFGPVGVGKTHLSVSVLRRVAEHIVDRGFKELSHLMKTKDEYEIYEAMKNAVSSWLGIKLYFTTTQEYIRNLMSLFGNKDQIKFSEGVVSSDLLVIDDVGTETLSNWSLEEIFYIVSNRYERNLPTLFTSNYDLAELYSKYLKKLPPLEIEKMLSRIKGFTAGVKIEGEDKRKEGK